MGNTYQINTAMNDQTLHPLQKFGDSGDDSTIITYSNDLYHKNELLPQQFIINSDGNVGSEDGLACKEKCIEEPSM